MPGLGPPSVDAQSSRKAGKVQVVFEYLAGGHIDQVQGSKFLEAVAVYRATLNLPFPGSRQFVIGFGQ